MIAWCGLLTFVALVTTSAYPLELPPAPARPITGAGISRETVGGVTRRDSSALRMTSGPITNPYSGHQAVTDSAGRLLIYDTSGKLVANHQVAEEGPADGWSGSNWLGGTDLPY